MNWETARKQAAGIVVLRPSARGWLVLILRSYRNWDFPKGLLELGESALDAAVRETQEETGLSDLVFRWGDAWIDTAPYAAGKVARFFVAESSLGEVTLQMSPELGRPEHDEFRWLTLKEAARLLPPRLVPVLYWARTRAAATE
jgi:bis(5'-nucleosidyl)-tetraphosphatase